MKNKFFLSFLLLFTVAGVFFSCKKTDTDNPAVNFPKEIAFKDYSLNGTPCSWKQLLSEPGISDNKIKIINASRSCLYPYTNLD